MIDLTSEFLDQKAGLIKQKDTQKITVIRKHGEELHRQIDIIIDKLSSKLMVTVPNFTPHKMNKEHLHQQLVYLS